MPRKVRTKVIIGISGKAGSGKDTIADLLVSTQRFVKVSLADELKRICMRVFDFSYEQLWGPSEKRNEPDKRYLRMRRGALGSSIRDWNDERGEYDSVPTPENDEYLTPRHALQQLGTEWGRACYDLVWAEHALRVAKELIDNPLARYTNYKGIEYLSSAPDAKKQVNVVIPDCRFKNEFEAIRAQGGMVIRVRRVINGVASGLTGAAAGHLSETEQDNIPDEYFDFVFENSGTLEDLPNQVVGMLNYLQYLEEMQCRLPARTRAGVIITSYKMEDIPGVLESEDVKFEPTGVLKDMLKQHAEDVESGKLMEYDAEKKDTPPFKRK